MNDLGNISTSLLTSSSSLALALLVDEPVMPIISDAGWSDPSSVLVIRQGRALSEGVGWSAARAISFIGPFLLGGLIWEMCSVDVSRVLSKCIDIILRLKNRRKGEVDDSLSCDLDPSTRSVRQSIAILTFGARGAALGMVCLYIAYTHGSTQIRCGAWPHSIVGLGATAVSLMTFSCVLSAFSHLGLRRFAALALILLCELGQVGMSFASVSMWHGGLRPSGVACYLRIDVQFGIFYLGALATLLLLFVCLLTCRSAHSDSLTSTARFSHRRKQSNDTDSSFSTMIALAKQMRTIGRDVVVDSIFRRKDVVQDGRNKDVERCEPETKEIISFLQTNDGRPLQVVRTDSDGANSFRASRPSPLPECAQDHLENSVLGRRIQPPFAQTVSTPRNGFVKAPTKIFAIAAPYSLLRRSLWWLAALCALLTGAVIAFANWSAILTFMYFPVSVVTFILSAQRLCSPPSVTLMCANDRTSLAAEDALTKPLPPISSRVASLRSNRTSSASFVRGTAERTKQRTVNDSRWAYPTVLAAADGAQRGIARVEQTALRKRLSDVSIGTKIRHLIQESSGMVSQRRPNSDKAGQVHSRDHLERQDETYSPSRPSSKRISPSTKRSSNPRSTIDEEGVDSLMDEPAIQSIRSDDISHKVGDLTARDVTKWKQQLGERDENGLSETGASLKTGPKSAPQAAQLPDNYSSVSGTTALRPGPRKRSRSNQQARRPALESEGEEVRGKSLDSVESGILLERNANARTFDNMYEPRHRAWMLTPTTEVSEGSYSRAQSRIVNDAAANALEELLSVPNSPKSEIIDGPTLMQRSQTEPPQGISFAFPGQSTHDSFGVKVLRHSQSQASLACGHRNADDHASSGSQKGQSEALARSSLSSLSNRMRSDSVGTFDDLYAPSGGQPVAPSNVSSVQKEGRSHATSSEPSVQDYVTASSHLALCIPSEHKAEEDVQRRRLTLFDDDEVDALDASEILREVKMGESIDLSHEVDLNERPKWAVEQERREREQNRIWYEALEAGIESADEDVLYKFIDERGFPKEMTNEGSKAPALSPNTLRPTLEAIKQRDSHARDSYRKDDSVQSASLYSLSSAGRMADVGLANVDQMTQSSFGVREIASNPRLVAGNTWSKGQTAKLERIVDDPVDAQRQLAALAAAAVVQAAPHRRRPSWSSELSSSAGKVSGGDGRTAEKADSPLITPVGLIHSVTPPPPPPPPPLSLMKAPPVSKSASRPSAPRPRISLGQLSDGTISVSGSGSGSGGGSQARQAPKQPLPYPPTRTYSGSGSGSGARSTQTTTTTTSSSDNDPYGRKASPIFGYGERGAIQIGTSVIAMRGQRGPSLQAPSMPLLLGGEEKDFLLSSPPPAPSSSTQHLGMLNSVGVGIRQHSDESVMSARSLSRVDESSDHVRTSSRRARLSRKTKGKEREAGDPTLLVLQAHPHQSTPLPSTISSHAVQEE